MEEKIIYQISFDVIYDGDKDYFFFNTEEEAINFINICMKQNKKIIVEPYDEEMWGNK